MLVVIIVSLAIALASPINDRTLLLLCKEISNLSAITLQTHHPAS